MGQQFKRIYKAKLISFLLLIGFERYRVVTSFSQLLLTSYCIFKVCSSSYHSSVAKQGLFVSQFYRCVNDQTTEISPFLFFQCLSGDHLASSKNSFRPIPILELPPAILLFNFDRMLNNTVCVPRSATFSFCLHCPTHQLVYNCDICVPMAM